MTKPRLKKVLVAGDIVAAKLNRDRTLKISIRTEKWFYEFNVLKLVDLTLIPDIEGCPLEAILKFAALPDSSGDYGTMTLLPTARSRKKVA